VLTRLRALLLLVALLLVAAPAHAAVADGLICEKWTDLGFCQIWGPAPDPDPPGDPGPPGSGEPGTPPGAGGDPCGYTLVDPQPPASAAIWNGVDPAKADVYEMVCPGEPATLIVLGEGLGGLPPPMDPAVLAAQIIATMTFQAPPIEMMPPEGSEGAIVGVPAWGWVSQGLTTTGPQSASDAAGGVAVTITAEVSDVVWNWGDGTSLSCGIGTPYDGTVGPSPTCGHVYEVKSTKSDSNGTYTVSATATWTIFWTGGGESGYEYMTFTSTEQLRVTEINVINVPPGG